MNRSRKLPKLIWYFYPNNLYVLKTPNLGDVKKGSQDPSFELPIL